MAKQITFNFEGTDYTLEYTRATIRDMERSGFNIDDIDVKPMTILPDLFRGAFLAHHRFVKAEVVNRIFEAMADKYALVKSLAEMYYEPINTLMEEPENGGNLKWTPNWETKNE